MDRSPGFGSTACNLIRPVKTCFRFGSGAEHLNLAAYHNSLARSTKSTRSLALPLLVSIRFQILFHSPPGVLFTFPSRYYALSVAGRYSALGDGPPGFGQDSSCPALLRWPECRHLRLTYGALTPCGAPSQTLRIQRCFLLTARDPAQDPTWLLQPRRAATVCTLALRRFGLLPVRSPLLGESLLISFPLGT